MSACKIKASSTFITYLIWKDMYNQYLKKKKVFVNLDWLHSKLQKEGDNVLVNVNWNLQELHNWQGSEGHPVALFLQLWVKMADFPVCVASSGLTDFCRPTRHLQMPACIVSLQVALSQQRHRRN